MSYIALNKDLFEIEYRHQKPKGKKYKKYGDICNTTMSFDIETSNGYYKNGVVYPFDKSKSPDFWEDYEKVGIMYIWQFAIDNNVFYGRTTEDLIEFMDDLDRACPILKFVYVHNLGFEFNAVLRENFEIESLFARKERHPLTLTLADYLVEFRCSYQLTNLSLEACCREYRIESKKLDTLDYLDIKTPYTTLTPEELQYCINDVLIVNEVIAKFRAEYGGIYNIPLTQTGEVRRDVRRLMSNKVTWLKRCKALNNFTYSEYVDMVNLMTGGATHANRLYVNKVIGGNELKDDIIYGSPPIRCFDFSSSYPFVALAFKYPLSLFIEAEYDPKYDDPDKYAFIVKVKFTDIECNCCNEYLSVHKALSKHEYVSDNGKLIKAKECTYILNNVDMAIINATYRWEDMEILSFKYALVEYLPDDFRRLILSWYVNKTKLKGVTGSEDLYMKQKQKLNAGSYGMLLTKIYNDKITFENNDWRSMAFCEDLFNSIKEENEGKSLQNYFMPMQPGVWITSWARFQLFNNLIIPCDDLLHYYDTDSVYGQDAYIKQCVDRYNAMIPDIHKELAEQLGVDVDMFAPEDIKGIKHPIGILDLDGDYCEGVYMGAKRYAMRKLDGHLKQTVAGVRKGSVTALNDDLHNFNKALIYDYDASQKLIMTYSECQRDGLVWKAGEPDEYVSHNRYSNNLMPTTYKMNISDDYLKLVTYYQDGKEF